MNSSSSSANFFGGDTRTFDYKWLRFVRPDGWSGPHFDFVYMGRGSKQLHTCWVPFGNVPATMGTLTVLVGSHNLPSFAPIRDTYGKTDVDKDGTPGHFGHDPMEISEKYGGEWQTADFQMGDIIIFTMHTMHTSTKNLSDRWRISCDIRFQPAADPIDERWVGKTRCLTPEAKRFRLRKRRSSGDWNREASANPTFVGAVS